MVSVAWSSSTCGGIATKRSWYDLPESRAQDVSWCFALIAGDKGPVIRSFGGFVAKGKQTRRLVFVGVVPAYAPNGFA